MRYKAFFWVLVVASLVLLSGCEFLASWRETLRKQVDDTATQVTKTVEGVGNQIKQTKDSVDQKVEDVKKAVKEVNEAVDAVKKVTGGVDGTGSSTAATK